MNIGDRVKLTEKGARGWAAQYVNRRKPVDWAGRRGVLKHHNSYYAMVLWDGRRSPEQIPLKSVERAQS